MSELIDRQKVLKILYNTCERYNHGKYVHNALRDAEVNVNHLATYEPDVQEEKEPVNTRKPETPLETWRLEVLADMESEVVSASGEIIRSMARELLDYRSTHPKQVPLAWMPIQPEPLEEAAESQVEERDLEAELDMELYNLACKDATQDDKLSDLWACVDELEGRVRSLEVGEKGSRLRESVRCDALMQLVDKLSVYLSRDVKDVISDRIKLSKPKVDC